MSPFTLIPLMIWSFALGGALASFLVVVGERKYFNKPITGRSKCVCGRQLTWIENIPILSYLALRGHSKCCKSKIPLHYLLLELDLAASYAFAVTLPLKAAMLLIFISTITVPYIAYTIAMRNDSKGLK